MRRLTIVPCPESWEEMAVDADDRTSRRCERCRIRVTNVAELGAEQLDALVETARSTRVCARIETVGGHPRIKAGLAASFVVAALAGCASTPEPRESYEHAIEINEAGEGSWIGGVVRDHEGQPVTNALVLLQGETLPTQLEHFTNEIGVFGFGELPPGWYTVHVFYNKADVHKLIELPVDVRVRSYFRLNLEEREMGIMLPPPERTSPSSVLRIK